jgi:DNA-binding ferritin-like protein
MNLKNLLSALILHHHNFRILHWNVSGVDFDPVHSLMGDYYDKLGGLVDDVAEICISLGIQPVNLHEALELLGNDGEEKYLELSGGTLFTSKDCFEKSEIIFRQLINMYQKLYSDKSIPESIINVLQEHQQWFRKECEYKNKRRLSK